MNLVCPDYDVEDGQRLEEQRLRAGSLQAQAKLALVLGDHAPSMPSNSTAVPTCRKRLSASQSWNMAQNLAYINISARFSPLRAKSTSPLEKAQLWCRKAHSPLERYSMIWATIVNGRSRRVLVLEACCGMSVYLA